MKVRCPKRDCPYHECEHYDWHRDKYKCNHVIWCCRESGEIKRELGDVICMSKRNKPTRKKKKEPRQHTPNEWLTEDAYWRKQGYTSDEDYWEKHGVWSKQGIFGAFPKKR